MYVHPPGWCSYLYSWLLYPLRLTLRPLRLAPNSAVVKIRSKVTPANISRFKGRKKKIFCRAGILHVGPKWTLEKGSRGRCGWFLTGAIWRNFLCPKTLFLAVFWYLDWVYCSQLPQNASSITYKSYLHMLHRIFFHKLFFLTQKNSKNSQF